jgi:hypothetical protein
VHGVAVLAGVMVVGACSGAVAPSALVFGTRAVLLVGNNNLWLHMLFVAGCWGGVVYRCTGALLVVQVRCWLYMCAVGCTTPSAAVAWHAAVGQCLLGVWQGLAEAGLLSV